MTSPLSPYKSNAQKSPDYKFFSSAEKKVLSAEFTLLFLIGLLSTNPDASAPGLPMTEFGRW